MKCMPFIDNKIIYNWVCINAQWECCWSPGENKISLMHEKAASIRYSYWYYRPNWIWNNRSYHLSIEYGPEMWTSYTTRISSATQQHKLLHNHSIIILFASYTVITNMSAKLLQTPTRAIRIQGHPISYPILIMISGSFDPAGYTVIYSSILWYTWYIV